VNTEKNAPRLLGAAYLFVAVASLIAGVLLTSGLGSGSISDVLVNASNQPALMQLSVLGQLITSAGIVTLAALLYIVLNKQNKIGALIALGLWLSEALFVALSQLGVLALIPLSQDFVKAGAPQTSYYQTLGDFLYNGINGHSSNILMWFYCTGGLLWYYMFYKSNYIPRVISLFGLLAVSLALIAVVLQVFGYDVPIWVSLPLLPFELTIGGWLLFRGIKETTYRVETPPARSFTAA
jgi:hypothetical protein